MELKLLSIAFLSIFMACSKDTISLKVSSNRDFDTDYEVVETDASKIMSRYKNGTFVITDSRGVEVPYQLTYDGKLIFPVSVDANSMSKYKISKGMPSEAAVIATGRLYPERHDDMAWENDKIGFRAYGPGSQLRGERLFGYDIFLKRDVSAPVLYDWYALNENAVLCARIDSLKKSGNRAEADRLDREKSYHIDHGNGMDCYAVGPTLGAATTAIIVNDSIVYPWCFESYEVLDNGPLRFTVALNYHPQRIGSDDVTEHRIITLDAGTHLNRTTVSYQGIGHANRQPQVITGIVVHDGADHASCDASNRYIAYADPTQGPDNGQIYIGAIFTDRPDSAAITNHDGVRHVSAINSLDSDRSITYYWGAGWDRSDIPSWQSWLQYLDVSVEKVSAPLNVTIK